MCASCKTPIAFDRQAARARPHDRVWQAGTILLPVQSVGVMGDERTYEQAVALRAVSSTDGMTADWVDFPMPSLPRCPIPSSRSAASTVWSTTFPPSRRPPSNGSDARHATRGLVPPWAVVGPGRAQPGERTHTVQRKETAFGIAKQYGVDLNALFELNRWAESGIRKGDVLRIPAGVDADSPADSAPPIGPLPRRPPPSRQCPQTQ